MRVLWTAIAAFGFLSTILFAQERLTFQKGESWVTRFIASGGDIKRITGFEPKAEWRAQAKFDNVQPRRDLPSMLDWRWKAEGLQPIRNQGQCGSCWAFSVTATLEAMIKIQTGNVEDLAEQTLVSTCWPNEDCRGGDFDAFDYIQNPGLPDEAQDPYRAKNSRCKSGLEPKEKIVSWSFVGSRDSSPTTEQIKTALMEHGPLSVTVCADKPFMNYKSGVFNQCSQCQINHMVNIEGWNDDGQYWIMRNSWGTSWGDNGYMNIRYTDSSGRKCNGIADQAAYVVYGDGVIPH